MRLRGLFISEKGELIDSPWAMLLRKMQVKIQKGRT